MGRAMAALVVAGCSGSTTITVEVALDPPHFIAYRDGASAWATPRTLDGGTYAAHRYTFEATGDYAVVAAWVDPGSGPVISNELDATIEDGTHWYLAGAAYEIDDVVVEHGLASSCTPPDMPVAISGSVIASGTMAQPGQVSIGDGCTWSNMPSWLYRVSVLPGVRDVIATDPLGTRSPRVAITRGVTIDAGATIPAIDLATNGQPLETTTLDIVDTGTAGDVVSIETELALRTANGGATLMWSSDALPTRPHAVPGVPASLLEAGDSQTLAIATTDDTNARRSATTRHPTETALFELLPLPAAAYTTDTGVDVVSWSERLNARVQLVDLNTYDSATAISQTVSATARWLESRRRTSVAFDVDVPGFERSWAVDVARPHATYFTVRATEGVVGYATSRPQDL